MHPTVPVVSIDFFFFFFFMYRGFLMASVIKFYYAVGPIKFYRFCATMAFLLYPDSPQQR